MEKKMCFHCEKESEKITRINDIDVCDKCISNFYFECINCGEYEFIDSQYETNNGIVCENCFKNKYKQCNHCEQYFLISEMNSDGNIYLCNNCISDYFVCAGCNNYTHIDYENYCEHCEQSFCRHCQCSCEDERIGGTYFDTKELPSVKLWGKYEGEKIKINRLIGVELEAEAEEDTNYLNSELPEYVGLQEDGSLNKGIEVITPPASMDRLENIINETTQAMRQNGLFVSKNCGTHIHIDARDIKAKEVSKFMQLYLLLEDYIYNCLPKSRENGTYCKKLKSKFNIADFNNIKSQYSLEKVWYKNTAGNFEEFKNWEAVNICAESNINFNDLDNDSLEMIKKTAEKNWNKKAKHIIKDWKKDKWNSSRYMGVNLQSYFFRRTIELRQHSGTLDSEKILNWINLNLQILEASKKADKKDLLRIKNEKDAKERFNVFCDLFSIENYLKNYFDNRYIKFNN